MRARQTLTLTRKSLKLKKAISNVRKREVTSNTFKVSENMNLKAEHRVSEGKNLSPPRKHIASSRKVCRSDVSCSNFFYALSLSLKTLTDAGSSVGLSLIFLSGSFFEEIYMGSSDSARQPVARSGPPPGERYGGILLHTSLPSGTPRSIYFEHSLSLSLRRTYPGQQ